MIISHIALSYSHHFYVFQTFRQVVKDSHGLAVTIAQYATSEHSLIFRVNNCKTGPMLGFDDVIIKFCADASISIEQRIIIINGFIEASAHFLISA